MKKLFLSIFVLFLAVISFSLASACTFDSDCPSGYYCNIMSRACNQIPNPPTPQDTLGPNAPTIITANNTNSNETITLQWSTPSDNGNSGTSSTYHLQISASPSFGTFIIDQDVTGNQFNLSQYGTFYWQVKAKDNAGNWGQYSEARTFTIKDTIAPTLTIISPTNTTYTTNPIWFNATASESIDKWIINYNGTNQTIPINSSLTLDNNNYNLLFYANDTSNNWGLNDSIWFTVNICTPNLQNTSWGDWSSSVCRINDTISQSRNRTQYDLNGCSSNVTFYGYQEIACDFCTPNPIQINESCGTNDFFTSWYNDTNECYMQTGLNSDKVSDNQTFSCDFCSYNITNTTWSAWANQTSCRANNTILQDRSKTEYDSNYSTCYSVTHIPSDLWNSGNNNTYLEYQEIGCDYDGAPDLQIISPTNTTYANATILVNISANDSTLDKIWYNWNTTNYTYTTPLNITFNESSNTLTAWANDSLGNINSTNVTFTILTPDAKVNSINIYEASQETEYVEQQNSTVSTNISFNYIGNLTIRFFVNGTEKENKVVSFSQETKLVNFTWQTEPGAKNINVFVDAAAGETNLTNNQKNKIISVKGIDEVLKMEVIAPYSNGSSYCVRTGAYSDFAPIPQELWQNLSVQDQDKVFDYAAAIKKKSGIGIMAVSEPEQQQCSPPLTGNKTVWVLLTEFNDTNHSMTKCDGVECTPEYWRDKLFNETLTEKVGASWVQTNRTMRNFYKEASYNQLFINGTIVNMSWAKLNNTMGYYSGRQCELLRDAVVAFDPYYDFSSYNDSSNNITIMILHAGDGWETNTSNSNLIWSMSLSYCSPYATADGKVIMKGDITPESEAGNYKAHGTHYHELGHQLGMADLYDTGGGGSVVSAWDSMADDYSGNSTEGYGSVPNYFGAWTNLLNGWTNPQVVLPGSMANVTLVDHSASNGIIIVKIPIKTENSTEYFLLETRINNSGIFDYKYGSAILTDGILIWHIDDTQGSIGINNINTNNGFVNYKRVLVEDKNDTGYANNPLFELRNAAFTDGWKFLWNNSGVNDSTNSTMRPASPNNWKNAGGPLSGVNVYNIVKDGKFYNVTIKNSLLPNATFKAALNITSNASIPLENVIANISCDTWLSCPNNVSVNISANGNKIQRMNITTNATNYSDTEFKQINASVYGKLNATEKVVTSTGNDSSSANPGAPQPQSVTQSATPTNAPISSENEEPAAASAATSTIQTKIQTENNEEKDETKDYEIITSSSSNNIIASSNNITNVQNIVQSISKNKTPNNFALIVNLLLILNLLLAVVIIKVFKRRI